MISLIVDKLRAPIPPAKPTPRTDPTKVCVVETGNPHAEARRIVQAAPNSPANPLLGVSSVIFFPMVSMTRHPHVARPVTMPTAPRRSTHAGICSVRAPC